MLTKFKQENPDVGDFYTFTLNTNIEIPNTSTNEATNPINIPDTPTKQATDHLVYNYLQNTVPLAPVVEYTDKTFELESCEMSTKNPKHTQQLQQPPAPTPPQISNEPEMKIIGGKDIEKGREAHNESRKRRRTAVVNPDDRPRSVGRPTRHDEQTKIANEASDKDELLILIYSRNLILTTANGSEKKRKEKQSLRNMVKT